MKKFIVFVLLSLSIFAKWDKIELVDEFEDLTGEVAIISYNDSKCFIRISKDEKDNSTETVVSIYLAKYLGGKGEYDKTYVKVKNEKNEIVDNLEGYVWNNGYTFSLYDNNATTLIEFLKNSKNIKLIATTYDDDSIVQSFDVTGLKEAEKLIVAGKN